MLADSNIKSSLYSIPYANNSAYRDPPLLSAWLKGAYDKTSSSVLGQPSSYPATFQNYFLYLLSTNQIAFRRDTLSIIHEMSEILKKASIDNDKDISNQFLDALTDLFVYAYYGYTDTDQINEQYISSVKDFRDTIEIPAKSTIDDIPRLATIKKDDNIRKIFFTSNSLVGRETGGVFEIELSDGCKLSAVGQADFSLNHIRYIGYLNGRFIIAGGGGFLATSSEGMHYTPRETGVFGIINSVAYSSVYNIYVAAFAADDTEPGCYVLVSSDTITWTKVKIYDGANPVVGRAIKFNGATCVVASDRGLYITNDFIEWSQKSPFVYFNTVCFGGYMWVAGGRYGLTSAAIYVSEDGGETWQDYSTSSHNNVLSINFYNNIWYMTGGLGRIATSADGKIYTTRDTGGINEAVTSLCYNGGDRFIAGTTNPLLLSFDSLTWTALVPELSPKNTINDVIYQDSTWYIVGDYGMYAYSEDNGNTWTYIGVAPINRSVGMTVLDPDLAMSIELELPSLVPGERGVTYTLIAASAVVAPPLAVAQPIVYNSFTEVGPSKYAWDKGTRSLSINGLTPVYVSAPVLTHPTGEMAKVKYISDTLGPRGHSPATEAQIASWKPLVPVKLASEIHEIKADVLNKTTVNVSDIFNLEGHQLHPNDKLVSSTDGGVCTIIAVNGDTVDIDLVSVSSSGYNKQAVNTTSSTSIKVEFNAGNYETGIEQMQWLTSDYREPISSVSYINKKFIKEVNDIKHIYYRTTVRVDIDINMCRTDSGDFQAKGSSYFTGPFLYTQLVRESFKIINENEGENKLPSLDHLLDVIDPSSYLFSLPTLCTIHVPAAMRIKSHIYVSGSLVMLPGISTEGAVTAYRPGIYYGIPTRVFKAPYNETTGEYDDNPLHVIPIIACTVPQLNPYASDGIPLSQNNMAMNVNYKATVFFDMEDY